MREERQKLILELILTQPVETQQQLMELLRQRGFHCTQATLSRDIRALHLYKSSVPGGAPRYAVNALDPVSENKDKLTSIARLGICSFDKVDNFIVIKTLPGMAKAICTCVDVLDDSERLVGRVPGNNTVLVVMRGPQEADEMCKTLEELVARKG